MNQCTNVLGTSPGYQGFREESSQVHNCLQSTGTQTLTEMYYNYRPPVTVQCSTLPCYTGTSALRGHCTELKAIVCSLSLSGPDYSVLGELRLGYPGDLPQPHAWYSP